MPGTCSCASPGHEPGRKTRGIGRAGGFSGGEFEQNHDGQERGNGCDQAGKEQDPFALHARYSLNPLARFLTLPGEKNIRVR
jgi:hypothetical protein